MREMTDAEARAFMAAGTRTGKLAVTRKDGSPYVVPIWFVVDDDGSLVFTTAAEGIKGRAIRRDGRCSLCVDEESPPYAYVRVDGHGEVSEEMTEMLRYATQIGRRYMGAEQAEAFGRRNAVPGELLVRLRPSRLVALAGIAD
jgi:PPOX class probable F420-dependent enzyme